MSQDNDGPMNSYVAAQMALMDKRTSNDDESPMVRFMAKHLLEVAKRGAWQLAAEVEILVHRDPIEAMAAIELMRTLEADGPDVP